MNDAFISASIHFIGGHIFRIKGWRDLKKRGHPLTHLHQTRAHKHITRAVWQPRTGVSALLCIAYNAEAVIIIITIIIIQTAAGFHLSRKQQYKQHTQTHL